MPIDVATPSGASAVCERARPLHGDDLALIELCHPGILPVTVFRSSEDGRVLCSHAAPRAPLSRGLPIARRIAIAADLLATLEFLHASGFSVEIDRDHVGLDGDGRAVIDILSAGARTAGDGFHYCDLLRELCGREGSTFGSFPSWLLALSTLARRHRAVLSGAPIVGRRPVRDDELRRCLRAALGDEGGSFRLEGFAGSGRSTILRRLHARALLQGCQCALSQSAPAPVAPGLHVNALLSAYGAGVPLTGRASADLMRDSLRRVRGECRRLLVLVDDGWTWDESSAASLASAAGDDPAVRLFVASSGARPLPCPFQELSPIALAPLPREALATGFWAGGRTPSARRRARRILDRALDAARGVPGAVMEAIARGQAPREDALTAATDEGDVLVGRIDDLLQAAPSPERRRELLSAQGSALLGLGRIAEAREALEEGLSDASAPLTASDLIALARAQMESMAYDDALETLRRLCDPAVDASGAERYALEAEVRWKRGERDLAVKALEDGLSACEAPEVRARLLSLAASMRSEEGRVEEARALFDEAESLQPVSIQAAARVRSRRARAEKLAGHSDAALGLFAEAEELFRSAGDRAAAAGCRVDRANCLRFLGRAEEARDLYLQALDEAEAHGDAETAGLARFNRETLRAEKGQWAEALEAFLHASRLDERAGHGSYLALDRYWVGLLSTWMGDWAAARHHLEASEEGFLSAGESGNASEAAIVLAECGYWQHDYVAARRALARAEEGTCATVARRARALRALLELATTDRCAAQREDLERELETAMTRPCGQAPTLALLALSVSGLMEAQGQREKARETLEHARPALELDGHLFYESRVTIALCRLSGAAPVAGVDRLLERLDGCGAPELCRQLRERAGSGDETSAPQAEEALLRAYRMAEVLAEDEDPRQALSRLLAEMVRETRSQSGALVLCSEGGSLRPVAEMGHGASAEVDRLVGRAIEAAALEVVASENGRCPAMACPLLARGEPLGGIFLARQPGGPPYAPLHRRFLSAFGSHAAVFVAHHRRLLLALHDGRPPGAELLPGIIGRSAALSALCERARAAAPRDVPVLIVGESGTGKELFARALHRLSPRRERRFVAVNMAALPETLAPAELHGARRGAYSGAVVDRPGFAEQAHGGTLFLDEIGDVGPATQVALLRLLQEGEVRRLGDTQPRKVDIRFLFATHRDLEGGVRDGWFRQDLYYRVNVVTLRIPPLRERPDDVPPLAECFVKRASAAMGLPEPVLLPQASALLAAFSWPGNVRQLENVLTRTLVDLRGGEIGARDLPVELRSRAAATDPTSLRFAVERFERDYVSGLLKRHGGNRTQTARVLGLSRQGLLGKLKALGLDRPELRRSPS